MNFNFFATEISAAPVAGIWTVAFSDPAQGSYLRIQRDVENISAERELSVHYLEFGDQSRACYGAVDTVQILPDAVRFHLNAFGAERIGASEIVVSFSLHNTIFASMSETLAHIVEHGRVEILTPTLQSIRSHRKAGNPQ